MTMAPPQSAELKVMMDGIVLQVGPTEIMLSKQAAQQLLRALPTLIKSLEAMQMLKQPDEARSVVAEAERLAE